jgi:hypothetical protein
MKKKFAPIFSVLLGIILVLFIIASCCGSNDNRGYGYQTSVQKSGDGVLDKVVARRNATRMELRGTDGEIRSSCTAYKGEFDGHTWYVFYDNLASPSVEHDPLCKCKERRGDGSN